MLAIAELAIVPAMWLEVLGWKPSGGIPFASLSIGASLCWPLPHDTDVDLCWPMADDSMKRYEPELLG